jgi:signal transduction histidine kinase
MDPGSPRRSAAGLRPWLVALALWLALSAVAAGALWHLRRDALSGQERELGLLSMALTGEIDRGLRGAEEGLLAVREELLDARLPLSGDQARPALRTRAELMPLVRVLWLTDREGRVLAASEATPAPALSSFWPSMEGLSDATIAVSRPFTVPGANEALVALALHFDVAPSSGGGWILAAMPAKALLGAFTAALPAADARMAVYRSDGARLAGEIVDRPSIDEPALAKRLAGQPSMAQLRFGDGSEHLVSRHGVDRYGLEVVFTRNVAAVLGGWREATQLTVAALAILLAIMALSVHLVQRAEHRRSEAQQALQAQLTRASRLESLGTLAGGVAHDFNNVLAAIVGFGEMAQDAAPPGSAQARHLHKVLQAALRGKALVERILAFSRGGARASTVFELEPVVEEVLTLLSASLRPGVVLERRFEARGARVRGDATQVFEAVMNLCTNAIQAMPGGGMLGVQLARLHVAAARVLSHSPLVAGDYVALCVSDQGGGITPEVMEHLFEPFFTTRGAQSGTGLGLAVVHGVVSEFGGAIDVQSTPGQGARFTLFFPECAGAPDPAAPALPLSPGGAGQALLVVDDDPTLVALAEEMLRGLGYDPLGYSDPTKALKALRDEPRRFAAVITDELMPVLGGTQLTEAIRRFAPQLPVLLVSGYGGALLASRAAAAGVTRVLSKPLQRAELARELAEVLR